MMGCTFGDATGADDSACNKGWTRAPMTWPGCGRAAGAVGSPTAVAGDNEITAVIGTVAGAADQRNGLSVNGLLTATVLTAICKPVPATIALR